MPPCQIRERFAYDPLSFKGFCLLIFSLVGAADKTTCIRAGKRQLGCRLRIPESQGQKPSKMGASRKSIGGEKFQEEKAS